MKIEFIYFLSFYNINNQSMANGKIDLLNGSPSTEKNSRLIDTRNPGRLFMYQLQALEAKPFPGPSYFPEVKQITVHKLKMVLFV